MKKFTANLLVRWRDGAAGGSTQIAFNEVLKAAKTYAEFQLANFVDLLITHELEHADSTGRFNCGQFCDYRSKVNQAMRQIESLGVDKDKLVELSELVAQDALAYRALQEAG